MPEDVSIHDLSPLEKGGILARQGFAYQDHVAASFCLDMIRDDALSAVWCETIDDITLIWQANGSEEVEFVQVKNEKPDQLWTVAKLCQREKGSHSNGIGTSILEKSLANDRSFKEPRRFRIVTSRAVKKELEILTEPCVSPLRDPQNEAVKKLCSSINQKLSSFKSQCGNDCSFWVRNAFWDVRESLQAVERKNLLDLNEFVHNIGGYLAPDQQAEVYKRLLKKVQDAADDDGTNGFDRKKIKGDHLRNWLESAIRQAQHPTSTGKKKLQEKMELAQLPVDYIESAVEHQQFYRQEILNPSYLSLSDGPLIAREVAANLTHLRAELDIGDNVDSGLSFHLRCLEMLKEVQKSRRSDLRPPLSFLQGCMYDMTNRCLHRFSKVKA